jgi:hypothetical protein
LIEYEPYISQETIASILRIHHETIKRILKLEFGFAKVSFECIPYLLTDLQAEQRVDIATELLQFLEASSRQTLSRVFTRNESWLVLDILRNSMWAASGILRLTRVRRDIGAQK